jgi:hypothetical protein
MKGVTSTLTPNGDGDRAAMPCAMSENGVSERDRRRRW